MRKVHHHHNKVRGGLCSESTQVQFSECCAEPICTFHFDSMDEVGVGKPGFQLKRKFFARQKDISSLTSKTDLLSIHTGKTVNRTSSVQLILNTIVVCQRCPQSGKNQFHIKYHKSYSGKISLVRENKNTSIKELNIRKGFIIAIN